jgi:hypothetical protein
MADTMARISPADSSVPDWQDPNLFVGGVYNGRSFFVTLLGADGVTPVQPSAPIIFKIAASAEHDTIYLYDVISNVWRSAVCDQTTPTLDGDVLTVQICHLTQFAVFNVITGEAAPIETTGKPVASSSEVTGILAAAIVVPVVVAFLVIVLIALLYRKRKAQKNQNGDIELANKPVKPVRTEPTITVSTNEAPSANELTALKPQTKVTPAQVLVAKTDKPKKEESDSENESSNTSSSSYTGSSSSSGSSSEEDAPARSNKPRNKDESSSSDSESSASEE